MGKVVELDAPGTEARANRARRARRRSSKTALVLGGGGFTGGVYEIGALRALDLLAVNRTVNEFDVYVGTSAGSFVASLVANGVTPEEMMRVLNPRAALADPRHQPVGAAAAQLLRLPRQVAHLPVQARRCRPRAARERRRGLGRGPRDGRRRWPADRDLLGPRHRGLRRRGPLRPRPHRRLPPARERALPDRDRPRHRRARRAGRGGVGRRADLAGGRRLRGAADGLRAGLDQGPRVHRRRHPLDHQRRRRRRARGQVHRRHQPAGPLRQRLQPQHPDGHRPARPARGRHGPRRHRQPGLPDALARPPPPLGRLLGASATPASTSS